MFSCVQSAAILGVDAHKVLIEADVSNGLPCFHMVGFVSARVKEASDRVRTALRNAGFNLPPKRITINFAPANIRKEGSGFDLPVAAAVLVAAGRINKDSLENTMIVGELGLDGQIRSISGILPMILMAKENGCQRCIVPYDNQEEGRTVHNIEVIGLKNITQLLVFCDCGEIPEQIVKEYKISKPEYEDFADVKGQDLVKRAAVLAASGFHNLLMVGQPGTGKTMIAKRIPGILPELTQEEALEVMKIQSIAGLFTEYTDFIKSRPFRAPHYTISERGLIGGGRFPTPGEVTLAHQGILFLDELAEMPRSVLESLRQPLTDKEVVVNRLAGECRFPADFLLIAAMNACPCGCYPDMNRCSCTQAQIERYKNKISQPILERFDLCVEVSAISYQEITDNLEPGLDSETMRIHVKKAREIQQRRFKGTGIGFNSQLKGEEVRKYCHLSQGAECFLEHAFENMRFSARVYHNIIKVAQTAADLSSDDMILEKHISEAICLRSIDRSTWRALP